MSDAESVEQSALMFVTFGDGTLFLPKRSDSHYAIMFIIFDDKKNAHFAIALHTLGRKEMKFAKYVFYIAGIYGLIALVPQYFLEAKNNQDFPPAITHAEYYYGFIGVALAFQIVFLIIARNPVKYRAMMIPSIIEKFSFAFAVIILYLQNRVAPMMLGFSLIDLIFGLLFGLAFAKTPNQE